MFFKSPINKDALNGELMNKLPEYIKPAVYGSEDKNVIALKEKALRDLFAGYRLLDQRKTEEALGFIMEALYIFEETEDLLLQAFTNFFLGEIYQQQRELNTALDYFKKAYQIFDEKKNLMFISTGQKIKEIEADLSGKREEFEIKNMFPWMQ